MMGIAGVCTGNRDFCATSSIYEDDLTVNLNPKNNMFGAKSKNFREL